GERAAAALRGHRRHGPQLFRCRHATEERARRGDDGTPRAPDTRGTRSDPRVRGDTDPELGYRTLELDGRTHRARDRCRRRARRRRTRAPHALDRVPAATPRAITPGLGAARPGTRA